MVAKILLVSLSIIGLALCHHFQDSRQLLFQQLQQQQPTRQQLLASQYQLPASSQILPNNANDGVRYGQQQPLVYMMPQGGQYMYEDNADQQQQAPAGGPYVESFLNLINSPAGYYQAASDPKPQQQQPIFAATEKAERLQAQRPSLHSQASQQQQYLQQIAAQEQIQYLQQEAQRQKLMALSAQPQYFQQQRPSAASPHNLFYYNFPQQQQYAQADKIGARPHQNVDFGYQKLFQLRSGQEQNNASSELGSQESQETPSSTEGVEEIGPSIAQAKPQAISVAGPGGVAAAAPVGTAIVGPGGMALSAPSATALAGTKPKGGQSHAQSAKLRQALRYAY